LTAPAVIPIGGISYRYTQEHLNTEASNLRDMSLDSLLLWMGRSQPNSINHEAGGKNSEGKLICRIPVNVVAAIFFDQDFVTAKRVASPVSNFGI
jgi:hypothetical protein